ncbi:MAG TPA: DUF47 family protein [Sphingomicrobium sp.]|nr:DUF47 family protein [Sphingomicrobium sp.]
MFGWFQRLLPTKTDFFRLFEAHAATLVAAADALSALAKDDGSTADCLERIERHEHEADDLLRQVLHAVRLTFLTPFDRGEITDLIAAMDDSIDEMLSAARAIDLYEVAKLEPEMKEMVALIAEAARITSEVIPLLRHVGRNGDKMHDLTERLVTLEGEADEVHAAGLKRAFQASSASNVMQFVVAREIFKHLERVTDAFEDVANEIDGIVIDHS